VTLEFPPVCYRGINVMVLMQALPDAFRALDCQAATTNESARSMSENLRRGRLTCVTRLPKDQQHPLQREAVSVSPSCHEESWHFECPRKLAVSNGASQGVASNPCCNNSSSAACPFLNTALRHPSHLHHAFSGAPNSPSSAAPLAQQVNAFANTQAAPNAHAHDRQWLAGGYSTHATWQQQQNPHQQVASFRASAQGPAAQKAGELTLAKLMAQHRARPHDSSVAWAPCKRQCTTHVAQQQRSPHSIPQPLSTHDHINACMRSTPSLQYSTSPTSHLNATTATPPQQLRQGTLDYALANQQQGSAAYDMLRATRQRSAAAMVCPSSSSSIPAS
jgi:hypothetical protein